MFRKLQRQVLSLGWTLMLCCLSRRAHRIQASVPRSTVLSIMNSGMCSGYSEEKCFPFLLLLPRTDGKKHQKKKNPNATYRGDLWTPNSFWTQNHKTSFDKETIVSVYDFLCDSGISSRCCHFELSGMRNICVCVCVSYLTRGWEVIAHIWVVLYETPPCNWLAPSETSAKAWQASRETLVGME